MLKRVFLLGYPVAHSVSPAMQNAAFRALGLPWQYELLATPPAKLREVVARLRRADCAGANVTIPHKQAVFNLVDQVSETARKIGAVNTIINDHGRLIGDNTDVFGVLQTSAQAQIDPQAAQIVIMGAGGGARAVAFALAQAGAANICILNRTPSRAAELIDTIRTHFPHLSVAANCVDAIDHADIIVNATPIGMSPHVGESPMPRGKNFPRGVIAFDLVYRPLQTQFLRDAGIAGAQTIDGLGMLVHQGAASFQMWTKQNAPIEIMFAAALHALNGDGHATLSNCR